MRNPIFYIYVAVLVKRKKKKIWNIQRKMIWYSDFKSFAVKSFPL